MKQIRQGFQTTPKYRARKFNSIQIDGDFHFCKSHNFIYNEEEEEEKLYNGLPCYYTDTRFEDGLNFFKNCYIYLARPRKKTPKGFGKNRKKRDKRRKPISLKACIRKVRKVKGIPKGTVINFNVSWYYTGRKAKPGFTYIERRNDKYTPDYQVNNQEYTNNFQDDDRAKEIVDAMRANGFLVKVLPKNPNRLIGDEEGQACVAFGYGKQIGFASQNHPLFGYHDTIGVISYDYHGEFDKWSRCSYTIEKDHPTDVIIEELKSERVDLDEE